LPVIAPKVPSPEPSPQRGEGNHKRELLSPTGGEDEGEGARAGNGKTFMPTGVPQAHEVLVWKVFPGVATIMR
jgi:hypothetical protein